jgi:hypothetical protein
VATAKKSAWLTVTLSGAGNAQTLTNAVTVTGLTDGAYSDTVAVSGGGASNRVTYVVNLTVGSAPSAPSNLAGTVTPDVVSSSVNLTWTDNASNETQFIVERQAGTGVWAQRGTALANATTFTDTGVAAGSFNYRVSAKNATGTSPASNVAAVTVALKAQITITGPLVATPLKAGDTVYISWTTANMTSILLEYSIDDGVTFVLMDGITGQLLPADARWNHFPFKVPASTNVLIRATSYTNHSVFDVKGPYQITPSAVQQQTVALRHSVSRIRQSALQSLANGHALAGGAWSQVLVVGLDGAVVGRVSGGASLNGARRISQGRYCGLAK